MTLHIPWNDQGEKLFSWDTFLLLSLHEETGHLCIGQSSRYEHGLHHSDHGQLNI